jgi:uncharacterized protein (TIGR03546 family)
MFLLRKIAKVLRGAATPFQVTLACLLGSLLGFVPSFTRAPALVIGLVLLLVVFNANLAVAGLIGLAAKLAALLLGGVSFAAGQWLLDGPPRELMRGLINAPVFAWCGLEWYLCAGGLLVGLLFGIVASVVVNIPIATFRRAMAQVEDSSGYYQRNKDKKLVRFGFWLLFGPRHQWDSYKKLIGKRFGNPVRIAGVVAAAVIVGGIWFGAGALAGPAIGESVRGGLESLNGATVELGAFELDLAENRVALRDLALCDAEALDHDLFRAARLEGDLSGSDLLARRLAIDRLVVSEAHHGAKRATPGVRTSPEPVPEPPPPTVDPDEKTIEEWVADAEKWKARLEQAKEWLAKVKRPAASEDEETLRARLEREAKEKGYGEVAANHLITGSPWLQIGEVIVEGVESETLGTPFDLRIENLSSNPALVDGAPRLTVKTRDSRYALDVGLGSEARVPGQSFLDFALAGLPTAVVSGPIEARTGVKTLEGGTFDAAFKLAWSAGGVAAFDTPLAVKVKDSTVHLGKYGATAVKELAIPLLLRGPLDNPRVKVELGALADSLIAGGFKQAGEQLKQEATRRATELTDAASKRANDAATQAGKTAEEQADKALKGVLEGVGKEGVKDAEAGLKEGLKGVGKDAVGGTKDDAKKTLEGLGELNPFGKKKDGDKKKKKDDAKDDGKKTDEAKKEGGG